MKKGSSSVSNAEEKRLVGTWRSIYLYSYTYASYDSYSFTNKGTFIYSGSSASQSKTGNFKVSGGKITFTNIKWTSSERKNDYFPNTVVAEYKFDKAGKNEYLVMRSLTNSDLNYLDLSYTTTYSRLI